MQLNRIFHYEVFKIWLKWFCIQAAWFTKHWEKDELRKNEIPEFQNMEGAEGNT